MFETELSRMVVVAVVAFTLIEIWMISLGGVDLAIRATMTGVYVVVVMVGLACVMAWVSRGKP